MRQKHGWQIGSRTGQRFAMIFVAAALAGGCGPRSGQLHGTITFDGRPVAQGQIYLFRRGKQAPPFSAPVTAGSYGIVAPVGDYRVEIFAQHDEQALAADPSLPMQYLPSTYNSESTLAAEIEAGVDKELSLELKK